jgi:hypothetical protein
MSLLHWSRPLLAAGLVLAGCKSNAPAPAGDAGAPAAAATSKAPAAAVASGPALSYLKPVDGDGCQWIRQPLPSGEPTVFPFDAACNQSVLSWSPNSMEGLVFSLALGEGEQPRLWRVDFTTKAGKPVSLAGLPGGEGAQTVDKPFISKVGFDTEGRVVALVSDVYTKRPFEKGPDGQSIISFEGERYPVKQGEGLPGLAMAYRLEGAAWKRSEVKASAYGAEDAPGIDALSVKLRSVKALVVFDELPGQEAAGGAVAKLDEALPGQDASGKWMSLPTPGGALHYRGTRDPEEDSLYPSAPVRWEQEGKLVELEGLTAKPGDRLGFQVQGDLLLVFVLGEETRSAHVLDSRTKKSLVAASAIESATFWPEPLKP